MNMQESIRVIKVGWDPKDGHKSWSGKALRSCRRCLRCNLVALELATQWEELWSKPGSTIIKKSCNAWGEREVPWSLRLCTLMICSFKHCRLSLQVCCTLHKSLSNGDIFWDNLCLVDQWLGWKVLEKSFYDVQRFAEEAVC